MAINVMQAVWDHSTAENGALLVMLRIADAADPDGSNAWPKQKVLCEKTKLGRTAVTDAVNKMIDAGELVVERRDRRRGNSYTIILPGLESYEKLMTGIRSSKNPDVQIPVIGRPDSGPPDDRIPALLKENHPVNHPRTKETSDEVSSERDEKDVLDAGERLCEIFGQLLIADNEPAAIVAGKVKSKGWRDAARLLIVKDERDPYEAERLLRWSQHNDFWRSRILSMKSFRANYRSLRVDAEKDGLDLDPRHASPPARLKPCAPHVWPQIRDRFAETIGRDVNEIWLEQLRLAGTVGGELWLSGSARATGWVALRYGRVILRLANDVLDADLTSIEFADLAPTPTNEQPLEKEISNVA